MRVGFGRSVSTSYGEPGNLLAQPAHQVFDVSLIQQVRAWGDLYVMGENIFDEEYFFTTGTSKRATRPRTVTAGFRLHFAPAWGR